MNFFTAGFKASYRPIFCYRGFRFEENVSFFKKLLFKLGFRIGKVLQFQFKKPKYVIFTKL